MIDDEDLIAMDKEHVDRIFKCDERPQIRKCIVCGEEYNIDEGCCNIS